VRERGQAHRLTRNCTVFVGYDTVGCPRDSALKTLLALLLLMAPQNKYTIDQPGAPVRVLYAFPDHSGGRVPQHAISITFQNTSEKEIVGTKFAAVFIDSVGDEHPLLTTLTTDVKVKPGKRGTGEWYNAWSDEPKMRAWPVKVMFKDGTTWEYSPTTGD
jgi:hypothetical protein